MIDGGIDDAMVRVDEIRVCSRGPCKGDGLRNGIHSAGRRAFGGHHWSMCMSANEAKGMDHMCMVSRYCRCRVCMMTCEAVEK